MGNYATHTRNQLGAGIGSPVTAATPRIDTARDPRDLDPITSAPIKNPISSGGQNTARTPIGSIFGSLTNKPATPGFNTNKPPTPGFNTTTPGSQLAPFDYRAARGNPNIRNAAKLVVNEPTPTGPTPAQIAAQQQQQAQAAAEAQQAAQQAAAIAAQQAQFWANHNAWQAMQGGGGGE